MLSRIVGRCRSNPNKGPSTIEITTIGLDLAKSVFSFTGLVHRAPSSGARRYRAGRCLGRWHRFLPAWLGWKRVLTAHHWAPEISALGHEVWLVPPAYVKAYLRRQKDEAADAEAICEAVRRPSMRFVIDKGAERQAVLVLQRSCELLVRQRTMLINAFRGHCAESGLVAAQGVSGGRDLVERIRQADSAVLPDMAKAAMMLLAEQLHALVRQIQAPNRRLLVWHRQDLASQRLAIIPGVGVISATALAAPVTDPAAFRSGREFSASLGPVIARTPQAARTSWGGSRRWEIATSGSCSLSAPHRWCGEHEPPILLQPTGCATCSGRKPARLGTVAMANKNARIVWAVLERGETYRSPAAS
ncbi:IS110 family RNA-guided transposase [Tsuneonella sp. HG222]